MFDDDDDELWEERITRDEKKKIKDTTAAQKAHFLEQIAVPEATITVLTGRERENNTRRDVR